MRYAFLAISAIGLAVWYTASPDTAIYAAMFLSGIGLRTIFDGIERWRRA